MRIINPCVVYKFQTVNLRCPPSLPQCRIPFDRLLFDETFAQPCIFAIVNCADVALCVLLPCFNALPDIFVVMKCSVLGYRRFTFITVASCSLKQRVKKVSVE